MPKGKKRNVREYEDEIEKAAKRMKKKPEHLKSARTSREWLGFLENLNIIDRQSDSLEKKNFWEKVRKVVSPRVKISKEWRDYLKERHYKVRKMSEESIRPERITRKTGTIQIVFRSTGGQFASQKRYK